MRHNDRGHASAQASGGRARAAMMHDRRDLWEQPGMRRAVEHIDGVWQPHVLIQPVPSLSPAGRAGRTTPGPAPAIPSTRALCGGCLHCRIRYNRGWPSLEEAEQRGGRRPCRLLLDKPVPGDVRVVRPIRRGVAARARYSHRELAGAPRAAGGTVRRTESVPAPASAARTAGWLGETPARTLAPASCASTGYTRRPVAARRRRARRDASEVGVIGTAFIAIQGMPRRRAIKYPLGRPGG